MNLNFKLNSSAIAIGFKVDKISPPQPIREITAPPPLEFKSFGEPLIDWRIKGAAGGVGNRGINYLKQVEMSMPDGGYGIRIYASSYLSSRTATFNSGAATGINFVFKNSDDSNISPTDVGTIIVSASGQPDIVINNAYQGGISTEDVGSADGRYCVGYGDDSSGRTIIYNDDNTRYIPIPRCCRGYSFCFRPQWRAVERQGAA